MTETQTQQLLDKLCVELGFCLPPSLQRRIVENPPKDTKRFTDVVIKGEGMDATLIDKHLYESMHSMVEAAFSQSDE
jgi:hypothetical protein